MLWKYTGLKELLLVDLSQKLGQLLYFFSAGRQAPYY